jgi:hypothetical protein
LGINCQCRGLRSDVLDVLGRRKNWLRIFGSRSDAPPRPRQYHPVGRLRKLAQNPFVARGGHYSQRRISPRNFATIFGSLHSRLRSPLRCWSAPPSVPASKSRILPPDPHFTLATTSPSQYSLSQSHSLPPNLAQSTSKLLLELQFITPSPSHDSRLHSQRPALEANSYQPSPGRIREKTVMKPSFDHGFPGGGHKRQPAQQ